MTTYPAAIRPARVNRLLISALLVAAGFAAGLGVARFVPQSIGGDVTTPIVFEAPGPGGLSPDERQELRDQDFGSGAGTGAGIGAGSGIVNEGLSPDERDERD